MGVLVLEFVENIRGREEKKVKVVEVDQHHLLHPIQLHLVPHIAAEMM